MINLQEVRDFLKSQANKNWQFTLFQDHISVYGENRDPRGDMDKIAIIKLEQSVLMIEETFRTKNDQTDHLKKVLKDWTPSLDIQVIQPTAVLVTEFS